MSLFVVKAHYNRLADALRRVVETSVRARHEGSSSHLAKEEIADWARHYPGSIPTPYGSIRDKAKRDEYKRKLMEKLDRQLRHSDLFIDNACAWD